jgi:DNA-binding LacI/PurR family transcriptional regulator
MLGVMRPPSIRDVAQAAGVSTAAASMALRDKGRMSDATRARIRAAAQELGYRPNLHARSLVSGGRTRVLAIAMPAVGPVPVVVGTVEYFFRLLGGAAAEALELGQTLVIAPPQGDALASLAVDGAIVVDPVAQDATLERSRALGIPTVTVGRPSGEQAGTAGAIVDNDFHEATERMLDHLAETGARRPALIAASPPDSFQEDSVAAYRAWCARHEVAPAIEHVEEYGHDAAHAAAVALLDAAEPPDAIYATIDVFATTTLAAARERAIDVPGALRVATCSDSELTRRGATPLTTLDERPAELGAAAVSALVALLDAPGTPVPETRVATDLIVRASTVAGA